ncbi:Thioredoxin domain [Dillenia turbinata]|uniref:Thioredoxin domain n=1 Tax=Dillenia turbinata TaxID=194707 RepID=A0AAN8ZL28_9MAGN
MAARVWTAGIILFIIFGRLTCVCSYSVLVKGSFCPRESLIDSIFQLDDSTCRIDFNGASGVTEGDEISLQRALNIVHKYHHKYVAVLFYASWCPFSRALTPTFSRLSTLYPLIPHLAIEESTIRPSVLSKYGVHGFPSLFLLNSTMRVCYHGSRTLASLSAFYSDVTGIKSTSFNQISLDKMEQLSNHENHNTTDLESCLFSLARSPENLLREETYLVLATTFVLLRLLYLILPSLLLRAQCAWRRHIRNLSLWSLWEQLLPYVNQVVQLFSSLKKPCKRSNLQEGAMNAKAWASKSLASVSIGDASTSRGSSICLALVLLLLALLNTSSSLTFHSNYYDS